MLEKWKIHASELLKLSLKNIGYEKHIQILDINSSITRTNKNINGDISSNLCFKLAKLVNLSPNAIAIKIESQIVNLLDDKKNFFQGKKIWLKIEIAGNGFINFWLNAETKALVLFEICKNKNFGQFKKNEKKKVIVEYVSANPTGPLHVGHARQAVLGDVISKLLKFSGDDVCREFYYNDAGNQIENLALSVYSRLKNINPGDENFPEDGYRGDYILDIALDYEKKESLGSFDNKTKLELINKIRVFSVNHLRNEQKRDLDLLGVDFDSYKLESSFYKDNSIQLILNKIEDNKFIYKKDGAIWLKSTEFEDDKDRVMKKTDGTYTYFVPDIAYHYNKWQRGFVRAINIQGSDHHGTIKRLKAGLQALKENLPKKFPETILHKMVKVIKNGTEVKVSKRTGVYVTLKDLVHWSSSLGSEVNKKIENTNLTIGKDAVRFFLLTKKADSEFSFDIDLATKKTEENPVFYVQYAYARACSLIEQSGNTEENLIKYFNNNEKNNSNAGQYLNSEKESNLCMILAEYPVIIKSAVNDLAPHIIVFYLRNLASDFHSFYNAEKILVSDENIKNARLLLVLAVSIMIKKNLTLLGISSPRKM